jgi:hypothetical protein
MASVTSFTSLFNANEARLTASLDGFERGLTTMFGEMKRAIIDLPAWDVTTGKLMLRQILWTQQQLKGELTKLGYEDLINKFFTTGYNESEIFGETIYRALGKSELNLIPLRSDILTQIKQYDYTAFQEFGNQTVQQVSKQLVLNAVGGTKRSTIIQNLQDTLGVKAEQARLLADTSLRSFDRTVQWTTADEAGAKVFRYAGPADKKNRPFCAVRVGKEFDRKQIGAMNNGSAQFGNVKTMMGGPRCRHYWLPIVSPDD